MTEELHDVLLTYRAQDGKPAAMGRPGPRVVDYAKLYPNLTWADAEATRARIRKNAGELLPADAFDVEVELIKRPGS